MTSVSDRKANKLQVFGSKTSKESPQDYQNRLRPHIAMPELFDIKRSCTKLSCLSKFEIQDGQHAMQENLKISISQNFY